MAAYDAKITAQPEGAARPRLGGVALECETFLLGAAFLYFILGIYEIFF